MEAKEMFEKIEYKQNENNDDRLGYYNRKLLNPYTEIYSVITFFKNNRTVEFSCSIKNGNKSTYCSFSLNKELLEAIQKQMEEL